jgi:hypothetical protein
MIQKKKSQQSGNDDRGLQAIPAMSSLNSTAGYDVRGKTYGSASSAVHRFYHKRDMSIDEIVLFECVDSKGPSLPDEQSPTALCCAYTASNDRDTPTNAPCRRLQSYETLEKRKEGNGRKKLSLASSGIESIICRQDMHP